jgi:hypothetical protein
LNHCCACSLQPLRGGIPAYSADLWRLSVRGLQGCTVVGGEAPLPPLSCRVPRGRGVSLPADLHATLQPSRFCLQDNTSGVLAKGIDERDADGFATGYPCAGGGREPKARWCSRTVWFRSPRASPHVCDFLFYMRSLTRRRIARQGAVVAVSPSRVPSSIKGPWRDVTTGPVCRSPIAPCPPSPRPRSDGPTPGGYAARCPVPVLWVLGSSVKVGDSNPTVPPRHQPRRLA